MAESHLFFGRNVLKEALATGVKISEIYYANDQAKQFLESLPAPRGVPLRANLPSELREHSHQGVAFRAQHEFYLKEWDRKTSQFKFILLCNHIEDVQNLGSMARAAAAFGVDMIVHEERRSSRMNAVGLKVSAGQAFRLKFLEVSNLAPFVRNLADAGYLVVGLDAGDEVSSEDLYGWEPVAPLGLVVGSESSGISKPVRGGLQTLLKIPIRTDVESLNATQAACIAMSWIFEKTKK